jgi:hypothetical protein
MGTGKKGDILLLYSRSPLCHSRAVGNPSLSVRNNISVQFFMIFPFIFFFFLTRYSILYTRYCFHLVSRTSQLSLYFLRLADRKTDRIILYLFLTGRPVDRQTGRLFILVFSLSLTRYSILHTRYCFY